MVALFAGDFENALIWHLNWFGLCLHQLQEWFYFLDRIVDI
jgi:hypothetical protein